MELARCSDNSPDVLASAPLSSGDRVRQAHPAQALRRPSQCDQQSRSLAQVPPAGDVVQGPVGLFQGRFLLAGPRGALAVRSRRRCSVILATIGVAPRRVIACEEYPHRTVLARLHCLVKHQLGKGASQAKPPARRNFRSRTCTHQLE